MIGILLIAHSPLAQAFIASANHVFNIAQHHLEAIDVEEHESPEYLRPKIQIALNRLDQGQGVLILTDIIGATPCNSCAPFALEGRVAVVSGLSLPMLLRTLTYRYQSLDVVSKMALLGAQNGALCIEPQTPHPPYESIDVK